MTEFADAVLANSSSRERNPLRILLWLVLTAIFSVVWLVAVALTIGAAASDILPFLSAGEAIPESPGRLRQETVFMVLVSLSLAGAAAAALLAAKIAFKRTARSYLKPAAPFRWSLLLLGAGVFSILAVVTIAMDPLVTGEPFDPPIFDGTYPFADRLLYGGAAVLLLLIAASAEEVIFRGVLTQVSGAFTRKVMILAVINGLLFSAIHLDFDPASFVSRAILGAAFTWTVLRTGGLELAIGAHTANNLMIAWFAGTISEAADVSRTPPPVYTLIDAAVCIALVAIVIVIARKERVQSWIGRPVLATPA